MNTYYKPGSWNVICQVCGRRFKSDEVRKRWDGLIVCKSDYEQRHIADFIRGRQEHITVPYTAPEPNDVFVPVNYISTAIANLAVAGTAISGLVVEI